MRIHNNTDQGVLTCAKAQPYKSHTILLNKNCGPYTKRTSPEELDLLIDHHEDGMAQLNYIKITFCIV